MYDVVHQATVTTVMEFSFPILQIEILGRDSLLVMDHYGNLKILLFSSTNFMEKLIKVSVRTFEIVEQFRVKKREKIMNLMKSLPFKKSEPVASLEEGQKKIGFYKFCAMNEDNRRKHYSKIRRGSFASRPG